MRLCSVRIPGRRMAGPVIALVLVSTVPAFPASAEDQPNGATIQWAQKILDDQGFYQGRAHGRMDAATAAAITDYQWKNGLKATGRLDRATIDKMLETREPPKTMGNLADPNSRARSSGPMIREEDVRPQAAPAAAGVERGEGTEQSTLGPVAGATGGGGSTAPAASPSARVETPGLAGEGQPSAAPRSAVAVEGGEAASDSGPIIPMNAVRYALLGLVAVIVMGMGIAWWSSGRRSRPVNRKQHGKSGVTGRTAPVSGRADPVIGRKEPQLGSSRDTGLRAGRP